MKNNLTKVIKRSGMTVSFDQERITTAVFKAALSIGIEDLDYAKKVSDAVVESLNKNFTDDDPPTVEDVQDSVVNMLEKMDNHHLAKEYRQYRDEHARIREEKDSQIVVNDTIPYKLLYQAFTWNVDHGCDSIERLNSKVKDGSIKSLIEFAEDKYIFDINAVVEKILRRKNEIKIIMIAGPSSSGKTTTTMKINERLAKHNLNVVALNLDNYFNDLHTHPQDQYGDYDFERPEALDIPLINEHLGALIAGKEIRHPIYNFKTGKREEQSVPFRLESNQILLIDSLHGLYKPLTASVPDSFKFKFFIETYCQIKNHKGEFVRWTDIRLMRRMIRDSWHRHYTPVQTVGHWHYVRRSEMKYIVPFIGKVDYIFNGSLPYELPVYKRCLMKYKDEILKAFINEPKRFDAHIRAKRIFDLLDNVEELKDDSIIPKDSLIREFIGGSTYQY